MSATYETIEMTVDDTGIAALTINRPKKLNALNRAVLNDLDSVMDHINNNPDIRALMIRGAGDKAFVAGADILELTDLDRESGRNASQKGQQVFRKIEQCSKPVVALIHGYALGGGAELALACHIRIATPGAVFGLPEVSLGLIPGYGGTQRLPRIIGKAKAFEFILSGGQIKAEEAKELGLVNMIVEDDTTIEGKNLLEKILKNGPIAISKAIEAINSAYSEKGFETEAKLFGELCETEDAKEGTTAFLEKRSPEFTGK